MRGPNTPDEAAVYRFNKWSGNPNGHPYQADHCAEEIYSGGFSLPYQCSRKPGYGAHGMRCKQHASKEQAAP